MKVRLVPGACQGHGQCVFLCPSVFAADEQGFAVLASEDVPADAEDDARRAEQSCPERAIELFD